MNLPRPRSLTATLAAGVAVGGAAAVLLPSANGTPSDPPYRAPSAPLTIKTTPAERGPGAPRGPRVAPGTKRLVARTPDPAGGPGWAVQIYGSFTGSKRAGSRAPDMWCAQLVRIVDGRVGWIDGTNTFRPLPTQISDQAPEQCLSPRWQRTRTTVGTFTSLEGVSTPTPRALGGVVWAFSLDRITAPRLVVDGRRVRVRPSGRHSAFISFFPPARRLSTTLSVRLPGGRRQRAVDTSSPWGMPMGTRNRHPAERVRPKSEVVLARTADPGGGPSWGVVSWRRQSGRWCAALTGQIVAGRVGRINARAGTFTAFNPDAETAACPVNNGATAPTRSKPVTLSSDGWGVTSEQPGSTERALRLQSGRVVLVGRALPGVRSVTVTTSTSVRTVIPTGPAHAFLLAYDTGPGWMFGIGEARAEVTARYADGRTKRFPVFAPGL
jgi:hypothetical protein